jgi:DNA polymerase-1
MEAAMSRKLVWDIEGNGLLPQLTDIWMLVCRDADTDEEFIFTDYNEEYPDLQEGLAFMNSAKSLIGHNIIGYDIPALKQVLDWDVEGPTIVDTLIMSRVLNYKRFGGRHALAKFGEHFKVPKPEHEDWSQYSDEMLHRCREDVRINKLTYDLLIKEMRVIASKKPEIKQSLRDEHDVAQFCMDAETRGWLFDKPAAMALMSRMEDQMSATELKIAPQLSLKIKAIDKEPKDIKFNKNGFYPANVANYFGITQESALTTRMVDGPYSRIEVLKPEMGNLEYVKEFLYEKGWEPLEHNYKKLPNGRFIPQSPKLCSKSLLKLGDVGQLVDEYYTTRSRYSILAGWLSDLDDQGRLHGSCFTIGTPTARARHSGIVNVPSPNATWGKEMRQLFITEPGRKIVGSDSSGNQMRALCHYLDNEDFTNEVINGDVHQRNADILGVSRPKAKPFLYAFLFGGGAGKLGLILSGVRDAKLGAKMKETFIAGTPGLGALTAKVESVLGVTSAKDAKMGYLPAIDGRKIYTDSNHKALNYLLQSCEAVTCKAAVAYMMRKFKEENLDVKPLIFYHDEVQLDASEKDAKRVAEIAAEAFREAPKQYGVMIMDGESLIGDNWYDTH